MISQILEELKLQPTVHRQIIIEYAEPSYSDFVSQIACLTDQLNSTVLGKKRNRGARQEKRDLRIKIYQTKELAFNSLIQEVKDKALIEVDSYIITGCDDYKTRCFRKSVVSFLNKYLSDSNVIDYSSWQSSYTDGNDLSLLWDSFLQKYLDRFGVHRDSTNDKLCETYCFDTYIDNSTRCSWLKDDWLERSFEKLFEGLFRRQVLVKTDIRINGKDMYINVFVMILFKKI